MIPYCLLAPAEVPVTAVVLSAVYIVVPVGVATAPTLESAPLASTIVDVLPDE